MKRMSIMKGKIIILDYQLNYNYIFVLKLFKALSLILVIYL